MIKSTKHVDGYRLLYGTKAERESLSQSELSDLDVNQKYLEVDTGSELKWAGTRWYSTATSGAIDVHNADVHTEIFNQFIHYETGVSTTLSVAASSESNNITLTDATGFAAGSEIRIESGNFEPTLFKIIGLVGLVATLDTPLTFDHPVGASVALIITDLSNAITATATPSSPVIYKTRIPTGRIVHMTTLTTVMTDTSAMDFTTFGGMNALTYGIVMQATTGGQVVNFTNWKQNLDLENDAFPVNYRSKVGGGEYGLSSAYGIKKNTDGIVYMNESLGDNFRATIQENITNLNTFRIKVQGHYEGLVSV